MKEQSNNFRSPLELRCQCSRLLFKKLSKTLEVKCQRCKRIHVFTLAQLTAFLEAGNFCALSNESIQPTPTRDPATNSSKTKK